MTTTFTGGVQASLAPWNDPEGAWQAYNAALSSMFEQVYGIVAPQGSPDQANYTAGWSVLLDPNNCPTQFLPYLSMFNGSGVLPNTPDASARQIIGQEAGFQRGTPAAIVSAAKRFLSGTQSVANYERLAGDQVTPDAYHFVIVVKAAELISQTQLVAAVNAVKPGGLQWTLILWDGYTWNQAINTWGAETMTWAETASIQP